MKTEYSFFFMLLISWDSSHANREERKKTMRTEPNLRPHQKQWFVG